MNAANLNNLEIETFNCNACGEAKSADGFTFRNMRGVAYRMNVCKACRSNGARPNEVPETMKQLRFGVEIEWSFGATRYAVAAAIALAIGGALRGDSVVMADGRIIGIVHDGSVPNGGEMVTPIFTWSDMPTLQAIVRAMRGAGCRVDSGAGIHVHVDGARLETVAQVRNLVRIHHRFWPAIEAVTNIHAGRKHFCKEIDATTVASIEAAKSREALADAWYADNSQGRSWKYNSSRYHALNIHSLFYRGTVEFRHFNAELHAGKVRSFVELALALTAKAITVNQVSSKREADVSEGQFFRYLGVTGAEFKVMRHHLTNNARAKRGEAVIAWED